MPAGLSKFQPEMPSVWVRSINVMSLYPHVTKFAQPCEFKKGEGLTKKIPAKNRMDYLLSLIDKSLTKWTFEITFNHSSLK